MPAKPNGRRRKAQMELAMSWMPAGAVLYEYAVLVTSMQDDLFTLAQHYRDRGDAENNFDEWKNQWGWQMVFCIAAHLVSLVPSRCSTSR